MEIVEFSEAARERLARLQGSAASLRANIQGMLVELEETARDGDLTELKGLTDAWIADLRRMDDDLASHVARLQDGLDVTRR